MIQCCLQYLLFPKQRPDFIVSSISVVLPVLINASNIIMILTIIFIIIIASIERFTAYYLIISFNLNYSRS